MIGVCQRAVNCVRGKPPKQHPYSVDLHFNKNPFPASSSPRLRETYYITRCCCSWPLLLLPVVQGTSRTPTVAALGAMAEVFSDDLNLKIGDLLSRNLLPATRPSCARPLMLRRTTQARRACLRARPFTLARPPHERSRCCLREIQFTLAPALRADTLLLARQQRLNTHPSEKSRIFHPCISGTQNPPRV